MTSVSMHSIFAVFWSRVTALTMVLTMALGSSAHAEDAIGQLEKQQQALFEKIGPSVVFIATNTGFGSGFFVAEEGLVLTNAHVVADVEKVSVVLADGRRLNGQVVERAPENIDLALVQVPTEHAPALRLADLAELHVGAWVAAVGHGRGGIWSFNTGMVSNIYPDGSERPVFQTQIPLNPGNSGGPIVDRHGRVIGVVTSALKDSQSINFAIRSDVALRKLKRLAGGCACLAVTLPQGVALFVDGKMTGTGPRVVVPVQPGAHEVFAVIDGTMKKLKVRYPEQKTVKLE